MFVLFWVAAEWVPGVFSAGMSQSHKPLRQKLDDALFDGYQAGAGVFTEGQDMYAHTRLSDSKTILMAASSRPRMGKASGPPGRHPATSRKCCTTRTQFSRPVARSSPGVTSLLPDLIWLVIWLTAVPTPASTPMLRVRPMMMFSTFKCSLPSELLWQGSSLHHSPMWPHLDSTDQSIRLSIKELAHCS